MFYKSMLDDVLRRCFTHLDRPLEKSISKRIIIGRTKRTVARRCHPREIHRMPMLLMLCAPSNRRRPFSYYTKMTGFEYFRVGFLVKKIGINSKKCIENGK